VLQPFSVPGEGAASRAYKVFPIAVYTVDSGICFFWETLGVGALHWRWVSLSNWKCRHHAFQLILTTGNWAV
jgi:hypothetical protein